VGDAMDYDQARDATAEHAGRGDKCYAKPAGGVEPPMPMEDGDDVPAQVDRVPGHRQRTEGKEFAFHAW